MKLQIGLFFGGNSVEHEVSVISALQAFRRFDREKYDVHPIYISRNSEFYTGEAAGRIEEYRDPKALMAKCVQVFPVRLGDRAVLLEQGAFGWKKKPYAYLDVAFPVVHGTNVEDGALQGFFRTLGIPFAGCDVTASALGMDKYAQKLLYRAAGLPALEAMRVSAAMDMEKICGDAEGAYPYPVIVKPLDLGSSVGIKVAHDRAGLLEALDYAFSFSPDAMVEPAVQHLRELNCAVLGDRDEARASEVEEPVMGDEILSYEDKYISGGKGGKGSKGMSGLKRLLPAPISPELREGIRSAAVTAFRALNCSGVARVDFLMNGETGEYWVNEINTIPGSLAFYLWEPVGLPYPQILDTLVELALKRERLRNTYHREIETGILAGFTGGGKAGKI